MKKTFMHPHNKHALLFVLGLLILGAGCTQSSTITRCYQFEDEPDDGTRIILSYELTGSDSEGNVPATLTITDPASTEGLEATGVVKNGEVFLYQDEQTKGDGWKIEESRLVGFEENTPRGFGTLIDGVVANEITCE